MSRAKHAYREAQIAFSAYRRPRLLTRVETN